MPINFPNSPNIDDTFTENGTTYTFDGIKWITNSIDLTPFLFFTSDTDLGQVTDARVSTVIDGGSVTNQYKDSYDLGDVFFNEPLSPSLFITPSYNSNSFPTPSPASQLIYVTDNNTLAFSNGNSWSQFSTVAITGSYNDLSDTPDLTSYATETYVDNEVANLVNSAPDALDTLNELAQALDSDPNFATTITNELSLKVDTSSLSIVATTGSYNDLSDTPPEGASTGKAIAMAIVFG
jgi:hypothetical protein